MSLNKMLAERAGKIKVTEVELAKAAAAEPSAPRTAPGKMLYTQATVDQQLKEIEDLKEQLASSAGTDISLDLIDEVVGRKRRLSAEKYAELKGNLSTHPLLHPIVVRKKEDGRFELVAGHNRVAIYRELGRTTIPAREIEVEEAHVSTLAFFSNLLSPSLPDFEKYWNFKHLQEETGLSQTELAESAGLSKQHMSRIMSFDGLPDEAKTLLKDNPESLSSPAAQKLSRLAADGRAQAVTEAISKLIADGSMTQEQVVALARPQPEATPKHEPLVVKSGKKNFCDIAVRNNVVGVTFKGAAPEEAKNWATRIQSFIESELKKSA